MIYFTSSLLQALMIVHSIQLSIVNAFSTTPINNIVLRHFFMVQDFNGANTYIFE